MDGCLGPWALPNHSVLQRRCYPPPNKGIYVLQPYLEAPLGALPLVLLTSLLSGNTPYPVVSSPSLSSSCSSSLTDTPAVPLHPLFLLDLHFVPMGFHSLCGISNDTQDTHITVFSLNISYKLQTLAHSSIHSADVYCKSIARHCSSSNSKGAAFPALTF